MKPNLKHQLQSSLSWLTRSARSLSDWLKTKQKSHQPSEASPATDNPLQATDGATDAHSFAAQSEMTSSSSESTATDISNQTKPPLLEPVLDSSPAATVHSASGSGATTQPSYAQPAFIMPAFDPTAWSKLTRNARDCGASSIHACQVLEKTMVLLEHGFKNVETMATVAHGVRTQTLQLSSISSDIKQVSQHSRIVSLNASIEASRASAQGRTFGIVAAEMTVLSDHVKDLTGSIDERLSELNGQMERNEDATKSVGDLFRKIRVELEEFRRLMMRVEELSVIQIEQLNDLENKLSQASSRQSSGSSHSSYSPPSMQL